MVQACFIEVPKAEKKHKKEQKRRFNVSRVLKILGVSRNGYYAFKNRKPSSRQLKKEKRMEEIRQIHKESYEIYGVPKIAKKLREKGELVSDKTVGNYMRNIGIKACYIKQSIKTTIQPDFSRKFRNI